MTNPLAPLEIRWSWEAWEAAYGQPGALHWKPWPWEPELRRHEPGQPGIWPDILTLMERIREQPLRPQTRIMAPWEHEDELYERTRRELLDAYRIPQALRDAWQQIKEDR